MENEVIHLKRMLNKSIFTGGVFTGLLGTVVMDKIMETSVMGRIDSIALIEQYIVLCLQISLLGKLVLVLYLVVMVKWVGYLPVEQEVLGLNPTFRWNDTKQV